MNRGVYMEYLYLLKLAEQRYIKYGYHILNLANSSEVDEDFKKDGFYIRKATKKECEILNSKGCKIPEKDAYMVEIC